MERLALEHGEGRLVSLCRWPALAAPRGAVQIVHGMAEHAARYDEPARVLNAAGYTVYAHDQRGHGWTRRTGEVPGFPGATAGWHLLLDDIALVRRFIFADFADRPVFLLGHSMGSFLAQAFAAQPATRLAGLILSGGYEQPRGPARAGLLLARAERRRIGASNCSRLLRTLTFDAFNRRFRPTRTPFDWLSRDEAEIERYVADPLCGFEPPVELWAQLLGALANGLPLPPRHLPVFLLSGESDPVCSPDPGGSRLEERLRRAGVCRVAQCVYPGARHELFHETNRAEVFGDLVAWLEQFVAAT